MNQSAPGESVDEIRERVELEVAIGFDSDAEIVESVVATYDGVIDPARLRSIVETLVKSAAKSHRESQTMWPAETDCDRLDRAFGELNRSGVVARQHFSCCGTCGVGDIHAEMDEVRERGGVVRGYTFFHVQDTEGAVENGGLFLSYGSPTQDEATALRIGHAVVDALERHGLKTMWNGEWSKRIGVRVDWKRRRDSQ